MARGISLHVGINQASTLHFPSAATLIGAENDAREMCGIAEAKGFAPHDLLLGSDATYDYVKAKIQSAAATLSEGDIFLFTFAGHGFQQSDQEDDESDFEDEVLVLFDRELFDDEIRRDLLPLFKAGVRVLGVADACHSASVFTIAPENFATSSANQTMMTHLDLSPEDEIRVLTPRGLLARTISKVTGRRHLKEHRDLYRYTVLPLVSPPICASILLLTACQVNETTGDGDPNGKYTEAMLKVLRDFDPQDYDALVAKIDQELSNNGHPQTPTIESLGKPHADFKTQKPFTI